MKTRIKNDYYLFFVFLFFSSCASNKMLSPPEAEALKHKEEFLVLHTKTKYYYLVNYTFQEDKLIGDLKPYKKPTGPKIHIHISGNYNLNLENTGYDLVEIKYSDIEKIVYRKPEPLKSFVLIVGTPLALFGIFSLVMSNFSLN